MRSYIYRIFFVPFESPWGEIDVEACSGEVRTLHFR